MLISAAAVLLSFVLAPTVSNVSAEYLVGQQAEQEELQKQGDKGKVGVDEYYQEAELTVTEVQTKLTPSGCQRSWRKHGFGTCGKQSALR